MTSNDIIKTAFKVWGRDLYRTMSLTEITRELGVSKPALYRHFKDKEALLDAMFTAYFDDCTAFIKEDYDRAVSAGNAQNSGPIMMRTISEYYIRNKDAFIFSLTRVYNNRDMINANDEFYARGIDFRRLVYGEGENAVYPSKIQLVMVTLVFCIAQFHHTNHKSREAPTEEQVKEVLAQIEGRMEKGLNLDPRKVAALNYEALERQAAEVVHEDTESNAILRAVAGAVAEAGPWVASMEMVAKRSGLSKSGLYAHFKNKQDMLAQLFIAEFTRMVNFARIQMEISEVPEEQLYLAIMSIVNYLRSRPEILVAINWIKTRRLELGKELPHRLYKIIHDIKFEAIRKYDQHLLVSIAQWILFLIVNTLAWWPSEQEEILSCAVPGKSDVWAKNAAEVPNESFRILFRFIALGLEGLNTE